MLSKERVVKKPLSKILKADSEVFASTETKPLLLNSVFPMEEKGGDRRYFVEREAYKDGFISGEKAGMELGQKRIDKLIERMESVIGEISEFKENYYTDKEKELVELVIAVARKIIHTEISLNRDVVANVVKAAINALTASEHIVIKLNPEDLKFLKEKKGEVFNNIRGVKHCGIEEDSQICCGGCIIESDNGEVDARIDEGLKALDSAMREALGK